MPDISPVKVEAEADPARPGRTAYRLSGPSSLAVRLAFTELQSADDVCSSQFIGPMREAGLYWAVGEVIREVAI